MAKVYIANARAALRELAPARNAAWQVHRPVAARDTSSQIVARFLLAVPSRTALLAALTAALPDSAAIQSLQADSVGAELTLVAPNVGAAIDSLAFERLFAKVSLVGGVTRSGTGTVLERAVARVTFDIPRVDRAPATGAPVVAKR